MSASPSFAIRRGAFWQENSSDDEFKHLRLRNGLYIQQACTHASDPRFPTGCCRRRNCARLAGIAQRYDRGYGHFTTRQNLAVQLAKLEDVPDILAELASVEMHAIQTSGNCIRNVTSDHLAGVTPDELEDPRVVRNHPPVVDFPSRVQLPPQEIQDCSHRRRQRSRGIAGA